MIIAEIGNTHFGDMNHAKELIRAAHDSGADVIKSQAFKGKDIKGSMPQKFYEMCEFSLEQYLELMEYARDIGNDLFYSVFSPEFKELEKYQIWTKLAGSQIRNNKYNKEIYDKDTAIVSVARDVYPPDFDKANMLYVCDYLAKDPELSYIDKLREVYKRDVGYSDHTVGVKNCITAVLFHKANIIEKHFTIKKDFTFDGILYRDCIHSATPREFESLVNEYDLYCQGGLH